ncbi:Uncharacterised protein [Mycobacteroides abscessus subsp. abscessus]|nr:Uncharacterised protein [Mycobacteroides abscessus subsp. abscessus]
MSVLAGGGIGLGALPLLVHQLPEALLVHREPGLGRHLQGEFDRESIGVVQGERIATRQRAFAGRFRLVRGILEQLRTGGQGAVERGLLGDGDSADPFKVGDQLRVRRAHLVTYYGHQLAHHRLFDAKQLGGADDPAQQAAQHVAAAFIAGADPVTDDDRRRAGVVADDAVAHVILVVALPISARGDRCHAVDDGPHQVGFVDVVDTLQQTRDALDAHTGIDVLARQRAEDLEVRLRGALTTLVLHEHEIPDLDVAILVGLRATLDAVLGAAVVIDLRTGAARSGDTHGPVVVGHAATLNPVQREARNFLPQPDGLVVIQVDGGPQLLRVESVPTLGHRIGQQGPGQPDGLPLEVVAEGEVPGHLEERVVPGGDAHLVNVRCTDALLDAGGRVVRRGPLPQEERHELHHAGVDEQQVGVVEDHRGTRHLGVTGLHEVVQESLPDLVCLHVVLGCSWGI